MGIVIKTLVVLLATLAVSAMIYVQHNQLTLAKARAEHLQEELTQQQMQLASMHEAVQANQKLLSTLQHKQHQIHLTLWKREKNLDQLIQQKPEVRSWANTVLPDDIIRLRQHPTFTSANDYAERLSSSDFMSATSICAYDELRTDSNAGTDGGSMGRMCGTD